GRLEPGDVLHEVEADQEVVVVAEGAAELVEEPRTALGGEVADRAPDERDDAPAVERQPVEMTVEVADDGVHLTGRMERVDLRGGLAQDLFADVERDEPAQPPG